MKKKSILLLLCASLLLFLLCACTKQHDISKADHDNIVDAGIEEYIAVDDGKYYLYGVNKTKKLTESYDNLKYIDTVSDDFLLGYKSGDDGYSIITSDGGTLLMSDKDKSITGAKLIYDVKIDDTGACNYSIYGFIVEFVNQGKNNTAVYNLDGEGYVSDFCQAEVLKTSLTSEEFSIIYIYFTAYDKGGKVISRKVLDKDLNIVHSIEFDENRIFSSSQSFKSSIGYVAYTEKKIDGNGVEKSQVFYDIYCNNQSFYGFESVTSIATFGNGTALFALKDSKYALFNEQGIVMEFDTLAMVENNNIKVNLENGLFDIYRYDGKILVQGARQGLGNYTKQAQNIVTLFSYEGKELLTYNINDVQIVETKRFVNLNIVSEAVKLIDYEGKVSYKFFVGGELIKEYDTSYKYVADTNGIYNFTTKKNDIIENYYYYNVYSGTEFFIKADVNGANNASFKKLLEYKYYTEKNSKNLNFYENAVKELTPYTGAYIPGYAFSNGYFNITSQSFSSPKIVILKMEFDTYKVKRLNANDVYTNTKERWYAYYAITGSGKASDIEHIYSGPSKMTISYNSSDPIICFSTIDYFADQNLYVSFDKLVNKTLVYSVTQNDTGDRITLTKTGEIGKSNMVVFDKNYLIGKDYKNDERNFVYTINGNKVLDAMYYISDIQGNLAVINYVGNHNNSFGVIDLEENKIVEKCNKLSVSLLSGGYYAIGKMKDTATVYTIKDGKGKTVRNNVVSIDFVGERYDIDSNQKCYFYKINLGKNSLKLFKTIENTK